MMELKHVYLGDEPVYEKKVIYRGFMSFYYLLSFAKDTEDCFDEKGDCIGTKYKFGEDIEILFGDFEKQGKRVPMIDVMDFEQHAESILRMEESKEKERLKERLVEWFIEFTEENYEEWRNEVDF